MIREMSETIRAKRRIARSCYDDTTMITRWALCSLYPKAPHAIGNEYEEVARQQRDYDGDDAQEEEEEGTKRGTGARQRRQQRLATSKGASSLLVGRRRKRKTPTPTSRTTSSAAAMMRSVVFILATVTAHLLLLAAVPAAVARAKATTATTTATSATLANRRHGATRLLRGGFRADGAPPAAAFVVAATTTAAYGNGYFVGGRNGRSSRNRRKKTIGGGCGERNVIFRYCLDNGSVDDSVDNGADTDAIGTVFTASSSSSSHRQRPQEHRRRRSVLQQFVRMVTTPAALSAATTFLSVPTSPPAFALGGASKIAKKDGNDVDDGDGEGGGGSATTGRIIQQQEPEGGFRTAAFRDTEYTNSRTASRDTNLSPLEAYDVIRQRVPPAPAPQQQLLYRRRRALDLGAGAGVSTQVLYQDKHYEKIDAVDWSDAAWKSNVIEPIPESVRFYAMDDDAFFRVTKDKSDGGCGYDAIVYNFAVNAEKASRVARTYLCEDNPDAVLLAPVNDARDYWYKQSYLLLDRRGQVLWKSPPDVGAWSVQFQPDVTSETCVGPWCRSFNGYHE